MCHTPGAWENCSLINSFTHSVFYLLVPDCVWGLGHSNKQTWFPVLTEQAPQSGGCNLPTAYAVSANRYRYKLPEVSDIRELSLEKGMF